VKPMGYTAVTIARMPNRDEDEISPEDACETCCEVGEKNKGETVDLPERGPYIVFI